MIHRLARSTRALLFAAVLVGGATLGEVTTVHAAPPESGPTTYTVPQMIVDAAWWYGLNPDVMLSIAWCESRYEPRAVGRYGEQGVFQFTYQTWRSASVAAGYGGWSAFNAEANVTVAAWLAAHDGLHHWNACR